MPVTNKPYTHEMVIIHRVFRRESALLPRLVAEARPADVARAGRLAKAIRNTRAARTIITSSRTS